MKSSVKLLVAAVGLVGSITYNPPAEIEYLEDDSLFTTTVTNMADGWEWGASKAQASGDGDIERICCGWQIPFDGPGGGSGGGGGTGGDDNSDYDDPEDSDTRELKERIRKHRECRDEVAGDLSRCRDIGNALGTLATATCGTVFKAARFINACIALGVVYTIFDNGVCDHIAGRANDKCDADFG